MPNALRAKRTLTGQCITPIGIEKQLFNELPKIAERRTQHVARNVYYYYYYYIRAGRVCKIIIIL